MNNPITIEGADSRMSLMKRVLPEPGLLAVFGQVDTAEDPQGRAQSVASTTIISEPKMALARPPVRPAAAASSP
jgi:hypothetical protein